MEWEFYVAEQLSMTVRAMRKSMSNKEFVRWITYYRRKAQRKQLAQRAASGKSTVSGV